MDFDSAITIVLFLLFFILPSILKQVKARKNKSTQTQKVSNPSFFTKIRDQIRQFVQELEQQAQQQKQTEKTEENIWETLSEDENAGFYETDDSDFESDSESEPVPATKPFTQPPDPTDLLQPKKVLYENELQSVELQPGITGGFRKNQLQNAIVWAEVLSKPVALRRDGGR